ncbi:MAG: substrate-binding domain-containing protein [Bacteroidota bacterium]
MKTWIFFFIGIFLLGNSVSSQKLVSNSGNSREGAINILTSPDLYTLTSKWAVEYSRLNPKMKVNVVQVGEGELAGKLQPGALGLVSKESDPALRGKAAWNMVVARDVIVPVMNAKNPLLAEINHKGVSAASLAGIFENPDNGTWGTLLGNDRDLPVHCYIVNDPPVKAGLAEFMKLNPSMVNPVSVENGAALTAAIQKDPNAIGFCRLASLLDAKTPALAENIRLLPIDKNGNGTMDYMEKIFDNIPAFSRGVWIGKYPKSLTGNIYAVATGKPAGENETAFLSWIITDGQQFLNQQGYSDLVSNERQSQLDKLATAPVLAVGSAYSRQDYLMLALLIILAILVVGSIIDMVTRPGRNRALEAGTVNGTTAGFDENSVILPKGLYFDKTHTWAFMEQNGSVKVGIDDFIQHITGTITRIEMKNPGEKVKKGDKLLTIIRNGKQLHLYAPVSGTITVHNNALVTDTSMINADPYAGGWVYMIDPANWVRETRFLTMADSYKSWLKDEFSRLRDFFAVALAAHSPEYAYVTMQDGGLLQDHILSDLDPKVWEDFQTKFIDKAW